MVGRINMALNREYVRKIKCYLDYIPKRTYKSIGKVDFRGFVTKERLSLEEAITREKIDFKAGEKWGNKWEYGWFFTEVTIPKSCEGQRILFKAELGECLVFVNGKVYGSLDREHPMITLTRRANSDERFEIAMEVYAGHAGHDGIPHTANVLPSARVMLPEQQIEEFAEDIEQKTVKNGEFGILHEEIFQFWMDLNTLYDLRNTLDENSLRLANIDMGLKRVCNIVDIEAPMDEFLVEVEQAREIMNPLLACKNSASAPTVYAIGHSHLDLEWLWTRNETRRKAARTLGNQIQLLKEYEDYIYIQSQPWLLETVKNEYPDLYQEVKEAVRQGKIIVEGGMWVESDANLPSGESLIRQFIFGKRFILQEFHKESEIYWLPDSFGCSASLPQIMQGCDIKYFMNAKVQWNYNGGDPIPHTNFMWKGIDGTEILTNLFVGYASTTNPSQIAKKWNENSNKETVPAKMVAYGHGDGGGGATRIHLEYLKREKDLEGMPKVYSASPNEYFQFVEQECDVDTTYVGELYYAAHRGSYTSQARTKKLNRQSEFALRDAEMWSTLLGADLEKKQITDQLWKNVLFNQFHDIIPGTSIQPVYEVAEAEYAEVITKANEVTDSVLDGIVQKETDFITVFNSLSWDRKVLITLPDGYQAICDMDGNEMQTQTVGMHTVALLKVPALGMKSYRLYAVDEYKESVKDTTLSLENNLIYVRFNEKGEMVSLTDKETGMEFLHCPSNVLRMYQDMPTFSDAWDIDSFYEQCELELEQEVDVKVECKGELYSSLVVTRRIHQSEVKQRIVLWKDSKRVDFETTVDWHETHKLLKVDFNTNIHTDEMISEIQFGHIKRPNHKSRQYDADRFEVCQHKWSALAEGNRGVAILNDCKYGISADGSRMSLTLLKAPTAPAIHTDQGVNMFTYSVLPFVGTFFDSNVIEEAYELNCPALIKEGKVLEQSLLRVSDKNVIVETIKMEVTISL